MSKLTPQRVARFLRGRRLGMPFLHAATYATIHRATAYRWLERGRDEANGGEEGHLVTTDEGVPVSPARIEGNPFVAFLRAEETGESMFIAANLAIIERAASGRRADIDPATGAVLQAAIAPTWQAAAWRLERRHPEEFGRRMQVGGEVKVKGKHRHTGVVKVESRFEHMTPDKADELADRILNAENRQDEPA